MTTDSRLTNFRTLTPSQRRTHIVNAASLTAEEEALLSKPGALSIERADGMIENVIGTFELPFAIAGNFLINGRDVLAPMVVEEPSVVAAASFMAKFVTRIVDRDDNAPFDQALFDHCQELGWVRFPKKASPGAKLGAASGDGGTCALNKL